MVADINLSVMPPLRCLSHGHISKTEQDRPIVTMEHCWEVGIADSVATFKSSPDALLGRCSGGGDINTAGLQLQPHPSRPSSHPLNYLLLQSVFQVICKRSFLIPCQVCNLSTALILTQILFKSFLRTTLS